MDAEKGRDHVSSYLQHYVQNSNNIHAKYLKIYLNFSPYSKCKCNIWSAAEKVATGRFTRMILSYKVPGHTKFMPDTLFSTIEKRFYNRDVFNKSELLDLVREWATCHAMAEADIRRWKYLLGGSIKTSKASWNLTASTLDRVLKASCWMVSLSTTYLMWNYVQNIMWQTQIGSSYSQDPRRLSYYYGMGLSLWQK